MNYNAERVIPIAEPTIKRPKKKRKTQQERNMESVASVSSNGVDDNRMLDMESQLREEQLKNVEARRELLHLQEQLHRLQQRQPQPVAACQTSTELEQLRTDNETLRARVQELERSRDQSRNGNPLGNARASAKIQRLEEENARLRTDLQACQANLARAEEEREVIRLQHDNLLNTPLGWGAQDDGSTL